MKQILTLIFLVTILLINGCEYQEVPKLSDLSTDKDYYDYNENIIINFNIVNNGKTSFNPKIETEVDENCYYREFSDLASVSHSGKSFEKITVRSKRSMQCKNTEQSIILILKDKVGDQVLDKEPINFVIRN